MTTALDPHVAPTHVDTRTPILAATIVALAVRRCPTCDATGPASCRTASGRLCPDHKGRA